MFQFALDGLLRRGPSGRIADPGQDRIAVAQDRAIDAAGRHPRMRTDPTHPGDDLNRAARTGPRAVGIQRVTGQRVIRRPWLKDLLLVVLPDILVVLGERAENGLGVAHCMDQALLAAAVERAGLRSLGRLVRRRQHGRQVRGTPASVGRLVSTVAPG